MRILYTRTALRQLDDIFSYISADNSEAASVVVRYINNSVSYLGQFPEMGRPTDKNGVRILTIGRYPYLIFYRLKEHQIEILRVRHAARKPEE